MRGHPLALAALIAGLLLATVSQGADNDIDDPLPNWPKAGAYIPGPFHVLNLNGYRKNRYHCLVCDNSIRPVGAFLVRLWGEDETYEDGIKRLDVGQPLPKLLKNIDRILVQNPDGNMSSFVVFFGKETDRQQINFRLLGEDLTKKPGLIQELGLKQIVFAFDDRSTSLKYWEDLGAKELPKDAITRVFFYRHYRLSYDVRDYPKDKPLTDKDVEALTADFAKIQPPPVVNRAKPKKTGY
jgi:hypothetical protein